MHGPIDNEARNVTQPMEGDEAAGRPPGGKALLRLLHFLLRRGYTHAAEVTLQTAVAEEEQGAVRSRVTSLASGEQSLPNDLPGAPQATAQHAEASMAAAQPTGAPTGSGPQWRSLGPTTIPNGQTYGSSRVNVSGRVAAIAVDPHNPAHVLCGSAGGGVWESFDRGVSWAPRTDYAPSLAVGALAFDPKTAGIAYCGTGEGNFYWTLGAGLLKIGGRRHQLDDSLYAALHRPRILRPED